MHLWAEGALDSASRHHRPSTNGKGRMRKLDRASVEHCNPLTEMQLELVDAANDLDRTLLFVVAQLRTKNGRDRT